MANFPIFHGVTLANNSWIENLHVERLTADPVPAQPGRLWFNTTDKLFKYSTLDAGGAVIVRAFTSSEELVSEVTRIEGLISSETASRIAGDNNNATAIAAEVARAQAAEADLVADLAAEEAARIAGDATNAAAIAAETTRAQAAEASLTADIAAEAAARAAADTALQAEIDAEEVRAQAAEAALTTRIAAEETARAAADTAQTAAIATEVARAQAAEAALQTAINNEVSRATAEEQRLDLKIDALGNALNYVGLVQGGADLASAFDMLTLAEKDAGDFYKVSEGGYFKVGASGAEFFANTGDALVFNLVNGVDKIDNTDSEVTGTPNFVSVVGTTDTGFVVDIATTFKNRVSTAEADILAEVARATAVEADLAADIAAEAADRAAADAALQAEIDAEEVVRAAGDASNAAAIAAETSRAQTAESGLRTDLNAEVTRAQSTEQALGVRIDGETADRIAGDNALDARLDAIEAQVSGATGDLANLTTTYRDDLVGAINEVNAEAGALRTDLTAETSARTAADSANAAAIAAETARATAAEGVLDSKIDLEIANRVAADSQIRSDYNARGYTFQSSVAATTHTISHGLNSAFVQFTVLVQRMDGTFRNDIVSVAETDQNTLTVYLATAANIKIAVRSMTGL